MSAHVRLSRPKIPNGVFAPSRRLLCRQFAHATNSFILRNEVDKEAESSGESNRRLAVKDNIATRHLPTTCASRILAGQEIPFTATIVKLLQEHGYRVVGKTNMDEFGMGTHSTKSAFGKVHNVQRLHDRSAGGSSGGSAVALREQEAVVSLGTDTGGSVRMPAAYTGTIGFKPSYGMISRWGVVPYANSLDTVGLMANNVDCIQDLVQFLYDKHDPKDPTSLPISARQRCTRQRQCYAESSIKLPIQSEAVEGQSLAGITFGVPIEYNIEELDVRIRKGWEDSIKSIQTVGGRVVPVSMPSTKSALSAYYVIAPAEAASNLSKYDGIRYGNRDEEASSDAFEGVLYAGSRGKGFGAEVKRRILLGSYSLSSQAIDNYFIQAQKVRQLVRKDFDRVFALSNPLQDEQAFDLSEMEETIELETKLGPTQVDFLVCPTAPTLPPKLEDIEKLTPLDSYMNDVFTVPASLAGVPAISIPMSLPAAPSKSSADEDVNFGGLQLIGQYWDDARLLHAAKALSSLVA